MFVEISLSYSLNTRYAKCEGLHFEEFFYPEHMGWSVLFQIFFPRLHGARS
jgi:hypothetical protein